MWTEGTINGYKFCIKNFEEPSEYGINNGRISKLDIRKDGVILASYDRVWDIKIKDAGCREVYRAIIKQYN